MNRHLLARATNVLLGAAIVASPQTFGQSGTISHFHWSERLAHELDYKNTIAVASKLTQKGRAELLAFVLDRFEHPINSHDADMFEGISDKQVQKLAAQTRIELDDLNGDGKAEIIAQGNGLG